MKKIYFIGLITLLITSCDKSITNFQSKDFIKFFGSGNGSDGVSMLELPGEGYIFTGYDKSDLQINQLYVVKTDVYGNTIWENRFSSENDSIQEGLIIKKLDDDNFIIVGNSQVSSSDYVNPIVLKINKYGELQWKKRIAENYDLQIKDFAVYSDQLFLVGEMYKVSTTLPDTYIASLNSSGEIIDTVTNNHGVRSDSFNRVFVNSNGNLIVVGNTNSTLGSTVKTVTVTEYRTNSLYTSSNYIEIGTTTNQVLEDAILYDNQLYILVYENNTGTRVIKLNADYSVDWQTDLISQVEGTSVAINKDGTLYFTGNYGNSFYFVKVDNQGTAYYGDATFKTYPGTIARVLNTSDNGLVMVGSTPSGYGSMVQLIKTDSDLYLFKP